MSTTRRAGCPLKGPRRPPPLRGLANGQNVGLGDAGGFCLRGDANSGVCSPHARARTHKSTRAHMRVHTPERAHGSAGCPDARGPRHRKPEARTNQKAPRPPGSNPIKTPRTRLSRGGFPPKDARAMAPPPLQETGRTPCLVVRPPGHWPAPAPAARPPHTHLGRGGGGGPRSRCGRRAGAASSAAGRARGHGPRRRRAGALPAAPFRPRSSRLRHTPLTARLGLAAQ